MVLRPHKELFTHCEHVARQLMLVYNNTQVTQNTPGTKKNLRCRKFLDIRQQQYKPFLSCGTYTKAESSSQMFASVVRICISRQGSVSSPGQAGVVVVGVVVTMPKQEPQQLSTMNCV